eukprot:4229955-Amphidinium_carterae.2
MVYSCRSKYAKSDVTCEAPLSVVVNGPTELNSAHRSPILALRSIQMSVMSFGGSARRWLMRVD